MLCSKTKRAFPLRLFHGRHLQELRNQSPLGQKIQHADLANIPLAFATERKECLITMGSSFSYLSCKEVRREEAKGVTEKSGTKWKRGFRSVPWAGGLSV